MSTGMYALGLEAFLKGDIDWLVDNIKALLVDSADYTANLTTHQFHSDVTGAGIVATSGNLASKDASLGVADAADLVISTVTGDQFEAIILYKDTGVSGTSPLICYIDNYTGLPCTPSGSNITIAWPSDANKIFKL